MVGFIHVRQICLLDTLQYKSFDCSGAFRRDDEVVSDAVLKSVGIDKENGFVFALDTMRAFELTKQPMNEFNPSIQVLKNKLDNY